MQSLGDRYAGADPIVFTLLQAIALKPDNEIAVTFINSVLLISLDKETSAEMNSRTYTEVGHLSQEKWR